MRHHRTKQSRTTMNKTKKIPYKDKIKNKSLKEWTDDN